MTTVSALASTSPGGKLSPWEYQLGPIGFHEVDISVEHCGICFTDLVMLDNQLGATTYPFVPGHEVIGTVVAAGDSVTGISVGDRVGLGWHAGYCLQCEECRRGDHNLCGESVGTILGRHGGFANRVRAQDASVVRLPESIDAAKAGPLLCGGIAVFNPLIQFNISPTANVAVIGIGGLGHLALQVCRAWGCNVTAITSSDSKREQALRLGAHETINSSDEQELERVTGRFDLILATVTVNLNWNSWLRMLRPGGRLHLLGVVAEPVSLNVLPMLFGQFSISSSPVGSPATISRMLDFAARHALLPMTEHFRFDQANEAIEHLRSGKARFRTVLSRE